MAHRCLRCIAQRSSTWQRATWYRRPTTPRYAAVCPQPSTSTPNRRLAGASYPGALFFHELPAHASPSALVRINVDSTIGVTGAVLPGMLERRRGAIVNVSSAAGRMPIGNPLYAVYSGTKAFTDYFSRSLAVEYASRGISVASHAPYFVATKMARVRVASLFTPSPDTWAAASLAAVGDGNASSVPYWPHALQEAILRALPTTILVAYVMSLHAGLRKRFLAKSAAAATAASAPASEDAGPSSKKSSAKGGKAQ